MKQYLDRIIINKSLTYKMNIFGIIIFILGIILFYYPSILRIKIGLLLLLLGFLLICLPYNKFKNIPRTLTGLNLLIIIIIWSLLAFVFTIMVDVEIFIIVVIIGILALILFTEEFIHPQIKKRMNIIFYIFIGIFVLFMLQKIINIVRI